MATNLGQLIYGSVTVLPGADPSVCGDGSLNVTGKTFFVGSSNRMSGDLTIDGKVSMNSDLHVSGTITSDAGLSMDNDATFYKSVIMLSTDDSTSTSTGALRVSGGGAYGKSLTVGGGLNVGSAGAIIGGALNVSGTTTFGGAISIADTTESSGSGTGSCVTAGGISAAKSIRSDLGHLYLGGDLVLTADPSTGAVSLSAPRSSIHINQGGSQAVFVNSSGTADLNIADGMVLAGPTGLRVAVTTDSSSSTTGSGLFAGGVGIAKTLNVGGNIITSTGLMQAATAHITGTVASTSPTTGTVTVGGGIGVSGNIYTSGVLDVASAVSAVVNLGSLRVTTDVSGANWIASGDASRGDGSWVPLRFAPYNTTTSSIFTVNSTGISVDVTTESSSTTTGAAVITGGLAVARRLNVGGDTHLSGSLTVDGSVSSSSGMTFTNTTQSTSTTSGALILDGGMGVVKDVFIGGALHLVSTVDSVGIDSGALLVTGGAGIEGSVSIGGALRVTSTATSTSATTGAVIISGGLGVGGATNLGGTLHVTATTVSDSPTAGAIVSSGGLGVGGDIHAGGALVVTGATTLTGGAVIADPLQVTDTTEATSATSGCASFSGGVGIAKRLVVGSATDSTSVSSGAGVITGGLGVGGSVSVGGMITLASASAGGIVLFNADATTGAAPALQNRSSGTRIVLHPTESASTVDLGIGVDSSSTGMWFSVPSADETHNFTWYGGATAAAELAGDGVLSLFGTVDSTSTSSGTLVVHGGAGVAGSAHIGGALAVAGATTLSGALTLTSDASITGLVTVQNTTDSSSSTTGAFVSRGGLAVALSANIGGSLKVGSGGATIAGALDVHGVTTFDDTTDACVTAKGSVNVAKTVAVGGNLTVGGNTTFAGDVFFSGGRTHIDSQTLEVKDNIVLVNSGPSGIGNGGFATKRYMTANDTGTGSLLAETPFTSGTAQAGGTSTTILLASSASSVDDAYRGMWIQITGGTGQKQVRRIHSYVGSTRVATIFSTADETANPCTPPEGMDFTVVPDNTSIYSIFADQYVLTVFDETSRQYVMATSSDSPAGATAVPLRNTLDVHAGSLTLDRSISVGTVTGSSPDVGVSVEGVVMQSGAITNVATINGGVVDAVGQVVVNDTTNVPVAIPGTDTAGSFLIFVQDVNNTGTNAIFLACGTYSKGGNGNRLSMAAGSKGESLQVLWSAGSHPMLSFLDKPTSPTGVNYTYRTRVVRVSAPSSPS